MKQGLVVAAMMMAACLHAQASSAAAGELSLQDAWRIAEQNNPRLQAARAAIVAAEAKARETGGLLWNNPEVNADAGRRTGQEPGVGAQRSTDWSVGLTQSVEIAGQHRYRRDAAAQDLTVATENAEEALRELRAEVERRFMQVLALRAMIESEEESIRLINEAAGIAAKRVRAGEDTRLDGNVAQVDAARARNQLAVLGEQLQQARVELAETLQWNAATLPDPAGDLGTADRPHTLEALLASAASRPLVRAKEAREAAARSRLALERAARTPDITVGVRVVQEGFPDNRDRIAALTLSVPLPLFRRNEANIGQASADLAVAQAEREAATRDTQATVRALWQRLSAVRSRAQTLRESILPAMEENRRLSQRALREGEINLLQLIIVNRQRLDARRDLIQAMTELELTRIALEQAASWSPSR